VHVAVDDYSRAAYVEVLPEQTGAATAAFLRRTLGWFARRGITVVRVLTDNGSGYISRRFRAAAARGRVRLTRTRPYRPQTNGKAERFIQTLIRGWAYAVPYLSSWRRTRALRPGCGTTTSSAHRGTRLPTTVRPLSTGRAWNNLVRSHS
jgi:transposase InsO family protein